MKKQPFLFCPLIGCLLIGCLLVTSAVLLLAREQLRISPMPAAVSDNAVASLKGGLELYSVMGISGKRNWDDITRQVYILHLPSGKWSIAPPVPGVAGRLGASAVGARGQVFVFGGYTVDGRGGESILPDVNSFVSAEKRWFRAEDIPVPVDRAVIGVMQNRYIYLVGGRSRSGPTNKVQIYDAEKNSWSEGTPFSGPPVFGHAGTVADGAIVYVDGAKKNAAGNGYEPSDECWIGRIDHKDPSKIVWSKLPPHPGTARFGIAAGEEGHRILFSGGTVKPHRFNGLDSEGKPVEVSAVTFDFDLHGDKWETINEETPDPRADTQGILSTPMGVIMFGGIRADNTLSPHAVVMFEK